MRFLIVCILLFTYVYADLQSKIYSNAQNVCYIKNISSGLEASDYNPTTSNPILRQTITGIEYTNESDATCNSWIADPYVNYDLETYQVIANMECSINSYTNQYDTVKYFSEEKQYTLDVSCNALCEIPKDSNGLNYEKVEYITENICTIAYLQSLVDAQNPNPPMTIDDAQYITCATNASVTGCYYKKHYTADSNSTDNNTSVPNDNNSTNNPSNGSNDFDDSRIVQANNNTTQAIKELIDMDRDKLGEDNDELIDINGTFNGLSELIDDLESSLSDIRNSFTNVYEPNIQHYNSCVYNFSIMNKTVPIDLCEKLSFLRPYLVFILTIYFLFLTFKIHMFFISVLMTKYG